MKVENIEIDKKLDKKLIEKAIEASKLAYAPYSHYHVGAALLTADEQIFTGCNVENVSFGATNCAERTAFFKAVSEGHKSFKAIAIVGGPADNKSVSGTSKEDTSEPQFSDYAFPCGVCRQVMQEFCEKDFVILVAKSVEDYQRFTLGELLPHAF